MGATDRRPGPMKDGRSCAQFLRPSFTQNTQINVCEIRQNYSILLLGSRLT